MWLCLNDGFVSIVQDRKDKNKLWARARSRKHLREFIRPLGRKVEIQETPSGDYRHRVLLPRSAVSKLVAKHVESIDYDNFKKSVKERRLHDMYLGWWFDHFDYQNDERERSLSWFPRP